MKAARGLYGAKRRTVTRPWSPALGGVLIGLMVMTVGCGATGDPSAGETAGPVPRSDIDGQVCEAVATVLYLAVERVMVVAADAPTADRAAVEDAYAEARRAVPTDLTDALVEIEQVYDQIGAEYLELVDALRRGAPYDQSDVLAVFESRRPALREIFERTGLDESCEQVSG